MEKFIYNRLKDLKNSDLISFHMPGHKYGVVFDELGYGDILKELYTLDTTEIIGTDNLHNPKDIILKSQENVRKILFPDYDDVEIRYLINGSSCGIEAAIITACKPEDKIIINRACHQSAYNACILANANPIFVNERVDKKNNLLLGAEIDEYIKKIKENKDAKAVFVTRPTYHGMSFRVSEIIEMAHENGMIVIVDEAHGAHFGLNRKFPHSAIEYGADIVIQSVHKSLPSITQTSIMIINDSSIEKNKRLEEKTKKYKSLDLDLEEINEVKLDIKEMSNHSQLIDKNRLNRALAMTESSSPSYIMMMSLEIAFDIYKEHGKGLMDELLNNIYIFKENVKSYDIFNTTDPTKIFINTINKGINGYDFAKVLRYRYNIQVELSNYSGILMLCTIGNKKKDFDLMIEALDEISEKKLFGLNLDFFDDMDDARKKKKNDDIKRMTTSKQINLDFPCINPEIRISPNKAFNMETESIAVEESLGKICGEFVIPYPPGVCLLAPGEVIEQEIIDFIVSASKMDVDINGMESSEFTEIKIIKE